MAAKFRSDIDGLKGIAIIAVVLYHFFDLLKSFESSTVTTFSGGFLGVDIFLIISGFLITSGIVYKLENLSFSLSAFYKRRLLRILPPLIAVCAFCLGIGYFILFPSVYKELSLEVINTLTFIGNYRFAHSGGYFALDSSEKLLLHTWYLCITIQFYLIYPLLILLLVKLFGLKNLPKAMCAILALALVSSYVFSKGGQGYLLTHTRIWEMFLGGVLFFYKDTVYSLVFDKRQYLQYTAEIIGVALFLYSIFTTALSNGAAWYISTSLLTVIGTSLVILAHNEHSLLDFRPLTSIGKFSYSLYLWHWPVTIFCFDLGYSSKYIHLFSVIVLVAVFTALSYLYIEKRQVSNRLSALIYVLSMIASVFVFSQDGKNLLSPYIDPYGKKMVMLDTIKDLNYKPKIMMTLNEVPVYKLGNQNEKAHTFVVGDSHSEHYSYYLRDINKRPLYFMFMHGTIGYGPNFSGYKVKVISTHEERETFYKIYKYVLDKMQDGDKVVIGNRWDFYYTYFIREFNLKDNDESFNAFIKALIEDFDSEIQHYPKLNFYIIGQGINTSQSIVNCLKANLQDSALRHIFKTDRCNFTKDYLGYRRDLINNAIREYAKSKDNVTFVDRNAAQALGDGKFRTRTDGGKALYYDKTHYTTPGGNMVGQYVFSQVFNSEN